MASPTVLKLHHKGQHGDGACEGRGRRAGGVGRLIHPMKTRKGSRSAWEAREASEALIQLPKFRWTSGFFLIWKTSRNRQPRLVHMRPLPWAGECLGFDAIIVWPLGFILSLRLRHESHLLQVRSEAERVTRCSRAWPWSGSAGPEGAREGCGCERSRQARTQASGRVSIILNCAAATYRIIRIDNNGEQIL